MPDDPLELPLDLVPGLPGCCSVRGDRRLYAGCGLHSQPVLLLLGPCRAFQLDQFISQFDCHVAGYYWLIPATSQCHTPGYRP